MRWWLPAGLARMLRLAGSSRIEAPEEAADAAEAALAGFRTVGAAVGSNGAAALVVDRGDRVAVCRRRGARLSVDEVAWSAIRATASGLLVDIGERPRPVAVTGVDALDVRRLRGQDKRSAVSAAPM